MEKLAIDPPELASTVEFLVDVALNVTESPATGHVPPQLAHVLQLLSAPAPVQVSEAAYTEHLVRTKSTINTATICSILLMKEKRFIFLKFIVFFSNTKNTAKPFS